MKKIKEFCKKNETELKVVGVMVGTVAGALLIKHIATPKRNLVDMTGKSYISWPANDVSTTLDRAKEVIELNKDLDNSFAVVKDSIGKYVVILFPGNNIITDSN